MNPLAASSTESRTLYPAAPPCRVQALRVSPLHTLEVCEFGSPEGLPAVVLHGGPGSGSSPLLRRFLDPDRFRIIGFDQRGAGRSTPRGALHENNTAALLDDLRTIRRALGIDRWLVVGGSWGATLALAHALDDPAAVSALLLRATFLARSTDIQRFFQGADRPEAWAQLASIAEPPRHGALLEVLADGLQAGAARAAPIALAWWRWEQALSRPRSQPAPVALADEPAGEALAALIDRYRVQSHYLLHRCWLDAPPLLDRCAALPRVPTLILHGLEDLICAPEGARELHRRVPHSQLQLLAGVGHDPTHPSMVSAMVNALDAYAARGAFERGGTA